jgi:hypothetical protein
MIDDDECEAVSGMRSGRGNRSTRRKSSPVQLCPPKVPHELTWARTRAAAVGSQRLTAWAMAQQSRSLTELNCNLENTLAPMKTLQPIQYRLLMSASQTTLRIYVYTEQITSWGGHKRETPGRNWASHSPSGVKSNSLSGEWHDGQREIPPESRYRHGSIFD